MIVLGIDPALTTLGWGIINFANQKLQYIEGGVIKTTSADSMPMRLASIYLELENIILTYNPKIIAMEETFINSNAISSLKLGYVRGAIMALVGKHNVEFREFKPNLIKKTLVGSGHAEKSQVLHMIKLLIAGTEDIKNFDTADALAVAYTCGVHP